jgi:glycosyltransferase involved in cell wall biosynthesis
MAAPETVVVVPALNEEATIAHVVAGVRRSVPGALVIVVDDGSRDRTADLASAAGAEVLRMPFNCGIGAAVQAGLRAAVALGADRVVRLDGDGQHDPDDAQRLLAAVAAGADCAIGSRFRDGAGTYRSSFVRRIGIRWFATALRAAGVRGVTDPTSGFFAANRAATRHLAEHYASDYPEVDAVVRLARAGFRLAEVPVTMRERGGGVSSIGALASVGYMVKVTAAILVAWLDTAGARRA